VSRRIKPREIFQAPAPRIFTIDPERPFLRDLACVLRASMDAEGAGLADAIIYLPTRRAIRALGEAFIKTAPGGRASLLPRLRAVGDIDEDEFVVFEGAAEDEADLPPAIGLTERRLTLARMVAARDRAFDGHENWAGALAAADALGRLLDSFYTEEIAPSALETLVPEKLAEHWRLSLDFLSIVIDAWPKHLQEIGRMDPADRRVKLIDRQRVAFERAPPPHPVIIAGTTGSTPAVARLMKCVGALPLGCAVLPGLDLDADLRIWDAIDAPHPQSGLKQLLKEIEVERSAVAPWPSSGGAPHGRRDIIAVALRPANASDSWRDWAAGLRRTGAAAAAQAGAVSAGLAGLELVEGANEEREADAVAIKIRGALETPEKKIILVTPSRDLACRVAAKLKRWKITVDDSAGVPFAETPCGAFLRLVARSLADISDAVALMAAIRHPLFGGGLADDARRRAAGAMDMGLRGLRPRLGLTGLRAKIAASGRAETAEPLLCFLETTLATLPQPDRPFAERFAAHLRIAEQWAADASGDGAARLWRNEDGEFAAAALSEIVASGAAVDFASPENYPDLFDQLIAPLVVRRRAPAHPRVAILGPLEARLMEADLVILGGLNEGVWPRDAAIDPFLSRPMRAALGLPSPEQRIGLSAHDFAQLAAAPEVMLTRATREGGRPAKPSRWIVRLKNILKGAGAINSIDQTHNYEILARSLDAPLKTISICAPRPRPPVDARPTAFSVTRVEKLLRDPYGVYARYILRLKTLDALNERFGPRHMGELFHFILKAFTVEDPPDETLERRERLDALFDAHAAQYGLTEAERPFWAPRIADAFAFLAAWEGERRAAGGPVILEGEGRWTFALDGRDFTLAARADRIDRLHDGSAFIIDYKTGAPPTLKQNDAFSPQLPLTGLIVRKGGFAELGAAPVSGFEYVRIIGRKNDGKDDVCAAGADCAGHIAEAEESLLALLRHFNDPDTPYLSQPRPQYLAKYGEYDHLARRRERHAQGGDD
jgi:ATP-dependent helicase/nuclease subunit B